MNIDNVITCDNCGSMQLYALRLEAVPETLSKPGSLYYIPINPSECYNTHNANLDFYNRPDIEVVHCLDCQHLQKREL